MRQARHEHESSNYQLWPLQQNGRLPCCPSLPFHVCQYTTNVHIFYNLGVFSFLLKQRLAAYLVYYPRNTLACGESI